MGRFLCCKGCQDRTVGCHGKCQKYLADRAENEKRLETIFKARSEELDIKDYLFSAIEAVTKGKR